MNDTNHELQQLIIKLHNAVHQERSVAWCHRLWSKFIKLRDNHECVNCGNKQGIFSHHIVRKSFLPEARFMTGNGITLCKNCHKKTHENFNGKPDITKLMDEQGGEKIELITTLFGALSKSANLKENYCEDFYYLSDLVLCKFKLFQGHAPTLDFPGNRIDQAYLIWNCSPISMVNSILEANGQCPRDKPFLPGITLLFDNKEE